MSRIPINRKPETRLEASTQATLETESSRRSFLKGSAAATAMTVAATSPAGCTGVDMEKLFQKHYKEMSPEDKKRIFARIEQETHAKHGIEVSVSDPQAIDGVSFVFCLDLSKCNGSRECVTACVRENNQSREPAVQYIKVLEMAAGTMSLEKGNLYYEGESVPQPGKYYMPVQCNQCDKPPCVRACPVEATWKEKDGIVVIDYDWCIGCRYCMAACPYEARHFNFAEPKIPRQEINPNQGYLSNRLRVQGVVEKCHFCLHRTRNGDYPACLEACPTGARKFGDLSDPSSDVAQIIQHKRVFVLKEELNTLPRFYYYFG